MTKRQWTYFALLAAILALSIVAQDVWIQPDLSAITGHFGYLCAFMLIVRLMLRYGQKWGFVDVFNAAFGAIVLSVVSIVLWREESLWVAAFNAMAALAFAAAIFVELRRLKHPPAEKEEKIAPETAALAANAIATRSAASAGKDNEFVKLAASIAVGVALYIFGTGLLVFHSSGRQWFLWSVGGLMAAMLGPLLPVAACAWSRRWWRYNKVAGSFGVSLIFMEMLVLDRSNPNKWDYGFAAVALLLAIRGIWEVVKVTRREASSFPPSAPEGTSRP